MTHTFKEIHTHLLRGGVIVVQTDTVIGLAASVNSPRAIASMYQLKQREGKPGTIIAGNVEQLVEFGFDPKAVAQAESYWPAPVSVVLPAPKDTEYLHMGIGSLAVRIPELPWLLELLETTGPLATSSANLTGENTVQSLDEARALFGSSVSAYVDFGSGHKPTGSPSQVIRFRDDGSVEYLRK